MSKTFLTQSHRNFKFEHQWNGTLLKQYN